MSHKGPITRVIFVQFTFGHFQRRLMFSPRHEDNDSKVQISTIFAEAYVTKCDFGYFTRSFLNF